MEAVIIQDLLDILGILPAKKRDADLTCKGVFGITALKNRSPYGSPAPWVVRRCPQQKCAGLKAKLKNDIYQWSQSLHIPSYGIAPDEDLLISQLDQYYHSLIRNNPQLVFSAFAHVESQLPAICNAVKLIFGKGTSTPDECQWITDRVHIMQRIVDYAYRSSACFGTLTPDTIHNYRCAWI